MMAFGGPGDKLLRDSVHTAGKKPRDIHRIGGGKAENLRLKPAEAALGPPGISVLKAPTPGEAAARVRAAFPRARGLHEAANTVGSTTEEAIRGAGFDIVPNPTRKLPNHHRIIHPERAAGFTDENLARLEGTFTNTTGHRTMASQMACLFDRDNRKIGALEVAPIDAHYEGTISLEDAPPDVRRLFEDYEEIVEGQMFSLLDDIEAKINAIPFKVSFENRTEAYVEDLQVFPSSGAISFKLRQMVQV